MRWLILTADYNSFLRDEFDGEFDYMDLNLPIGLVERIKKWHEGYSVIIPMDEDERLRMNNRIIELDRHGIELAKEIKRQLVEVKVRYYSEGLLRYIEY